MKVNCIDCGIGKQPGDVGWSTPYNKITSCGECREKRGWLSSLEVGNRIHDCVDRCTTIEEVGPGEYFVTAFGDTCNGMMCFEPCDCGRDKYFSPFQGKMV
jgi:hypothetical protein